MALRVDDLRQANPWPLARLLDHPKAKERNLADPDVGESAEVAVTRDRADASNGDFNLLARWTALVYGREKPCPLDLAWARASPARAFLFKGFHLASFVSLRSLRTLAQSNNHRPATRSLSRM
jgi:hypothetical protein